MSSTSEVHDMETIPRKFCNRRNAAVVERNVRLCVPPFGLINQVLSKVYQEQVEQLLLVTPAWQTQQWYAQLLNMSVQQPLLLPPVPNLLQDSQGKFHPLMKNQSQRLMAWKISGIALKWTEFQRMLPILYHIPEGRVPYLVTNRPGISGLAGVVGNKLIHL